MMAAKVMSLVDMTVLLDSCMPTDSQMTLPNSQGIGWLSKTVHGSISEAKVAQLQCTLKETEQDKSTSGTNMKKELLHCLLKSVETFEALDYTYDSVA